MLIPNGFIGFIGNDENASQNFDLYFFVNMCLTLHKNNDIVQSQM